MKEVVDFEGELAQRHARHRHARDSSARAKRYGISDVAARQDLGRRARSTCATAARNSACSAVFSRVDTCAAEFESFTPYLYSNYESACEADPGDRQEGHDPGQRPQPHRAGNRVRLLLLPRLLRAAGDGRRIDHGQLQSGDRLHRLRHQRPPLLRAAHARERAQHLSTPRSPTA